MRLIAKKPCSFCGRQFYIGDEIPPELVTNAGMQEKMGVIAIINNTALEIEQILPGDAIVISVKADSAGNSEQQAAVLAAPEEIQQVFSIMQMSAEEGAKEIAEVKSENVLILLHAIDSRKTIKNAVKEQADRLLSKTEGAGG